MPEGDAVWRTAARLNEALAGRPITEWELRWGELGASDKRGRTTIEVVPHGKHLLHRLDDGWTLHSHLRMEGRWSVVERPKVTARNRRDPWIRALVGTAESVALGRQLGMLDLVRTDREDALVGHLGPDLLGSDWDAEEALRRLRSHPDADLGAALLDQTNLAGIGTMWAAEICFLEKVNPWTPTGALDDAALARVVARAHRLLNGTLKFKGSVSTGNWRDPLYIYGKPGRPCPRCAAPIRKASIGKAPTQRELYYCAVCAPRPDSEPEKTRIPTA